MEVGAVVAGQMLRPRLEVVAPDWLVQVAMLRRAPAAALVQMGARREVQVLARPIQEWAAAEQAEPPLLAVSVLLVANLLLALLVEALVEEKQPLQIIQAAALVGRDL